MNPKKFNMKTLFHAVSGRFAFLLAVVLVLSTSASPLLAAESEEGEKTLEPLAWQTDLAIWTAVVFVILLVILWRFAFGPIIKALDQRERNELDLLASAEKNNADARELLEQYRQKLADSEEEVRRILDEAKSDARKQADAVLAEAKQVAEDERERALKDIQNASDVALREIAVKSAEMATSLAGKIIKEEVDPAKHARLIESAVASVTKQ